VFVDRAEAGQRLAEKLEHLRGEDVVVLGLPRGGVPVAFEVARALDAKLDVVVVRKLGVPFQPELGMGAIGEGNVSIVDNLTRRLAGVTIAQLAAVERRERGELERRTRRYRAGRPRLSLAGRTAVVVDDGIATGSTARVACRVARALGASRVVLAVPVAPPSALAELAQEVDEVVCLETPPTFLAVGCSYVDFSQTSDDEVVALLGQAAGELPAPLGTVTDPDPPVRDEEVTVQAGPVRLAGRLTIPEQSRGLVIFAHGSGSSRHSPRNRFVAGALNSVGLGTLLFDLLSPAEELDRGYVFDVELLAARLGEVTRWLEAEPALGGIPVGYFGASTGAAAALWAAADPGNPVAAVVSRGGRPDLAAPRLGHIQAPTLLIVGGDDTVTLQLNRRAQGMMACTSRVAVVPGATHLFEEPGALETVADLAADWLQRYLLFPQSVSGSYARASQG
jgi:putative phosphoribosyl transferase